MARIRRERRAKAIVRLTLSYSSEINAVLCPQRVSLLLKKNAVICPQRAVLHCCPSSKVEQLMQIKMAIWRSFLNLNMLDRVREPAADYNGCLARFKF